MADPLKHPGDDGGFELRVADRGRGMPKDIDLETPASLGLKVIMSTARQFGGRVAINPLDPGTEFVIRLPPEVDATKGEAA